MRLGTWNCAQALRKKIQNIRDLKLDICVIPEAERDITSLEPTNNYLWFGENKNKGLGVYSENLKLELASVSDNNWFHFEPIFIEGDQIRILATWAFNSRAKKFGEEAIGNPLDVFIKLEDWLTEKPTVVIGDFNNSVIWDKPRKENNFQDIHNWLSGHGFSSAYHDYFKQELGTEKHPTHYHRKSISSPYHIDYIYTNFPHEVRSVEVGSYNKWLEYSDHVPVIIETKHDF